MTGVRTSQLVLVVKNPSVSARNTRYPVQSLGREDPSPGDNGNLLQYSCLETSTNRGAWQTIVHRATRSQTQLSTHTWKWCEDKKQIWSIFLFKFKLSHKAVKTTRNINSAFGSGTVNEHTAQWWFKKFCKGDESLDAKGILAGHQKLTMTSPSLLRLQHWQAGSSPLLAPGKSRCLISGPQTKKPISLRGHLLFFYETMNYFWEKKCVLYDIQQWPAQWMGREEAPSTFQSQTCTKKMSWSLFGGLLPVWSTTALWILVQPLYLRSMLSKSRKCTKNCNACSQYWSTERAQFFFMTMPNHMPQQSFKSGMNWTMKFCLTRHIHLTSHQWTTTSATISTILCKENASTTNRRQKMLSKNLLNPKVCFFVLQK